MQRIQPPYVRGLHLREGGLDLDRFAGNLGTWINQTALRRYCPVRDPHSRPFGAAFHFSVRFAWAKPHEKGAHRAPFG